MAMTAFCYLVLMLAITNIHQSQTIFWGKSKSKAPQYQYTSEADVGLPDFTVALLGADYRFKCPGVIISPRAILTMAICLFDMQINESPPVYVMGRRMIDAATQRMENWVLSLDSLAPKFRLSPQYLKIAKSNDREKKIGAALKYPAIISFPKPLPFYNETKKISLWLHHNRIINFFKNKVNLLYRAVWYGPQLQKQSLPLPSLPELPKKDGWWRRIFKKPSEANTSNRKNQESQNIPSRDDLLTNENSEPSKEETTSNVGEGDNSQASINENMESVNDARMEQSIADDNDEVSSDVAESNASGGSSIPSLAEFNQAAEVPVEKTMNKAPLKNNYRGNHAYHVGSLSNTIQNQKIENDRAALHLYLKPDIRLGCTRQPPPYRNVGKRGNTRAWMNWQLIFGSKQTKHLENEKPLNINEGLSYFQSGLTDQCGSSDTKIREKPRIYEHIGTPFFTFEKGKIVLSYMLTGIVVEDKNKERYIWMLSLPPFRKWIESVCK